jgi:hypothetical protein
VTQQSSRSPFSFYSLINVINIVLNAQDSGAIINLDHALAARIAADFWCNDSPIPIK